MNAFFKYGMVISCGSVMTLASVWASEEQDVLQVPGSAPVGGGAAAVTPVTDPRERSFINTFELFTQLVDRVGQSDQRSRANLVSLVQRWQSDETLRQFEVEREFNEDRVRHEEKIDNLTQKLKEKEQESEERARLLEDIELREGDESELIRQHRNDEMARARQEAEFYRGSCEEVMTFRAYVTRLWQMLMAASARQGEKVEEMMDWFRKDFAEEQRNGELMRQMFLSIVESVPVDCRSPRMINLLEQISHQG